MHDTLVEKLTHCGVEIEIHQDQMYDDSPDDWGNEDVFLVAFHRDFDVRRDGFDKDDIRGILFEDWEKTERSKEIEKEYWVFGLEAYIHSDVVLSLVESHRLFPDRRWDVSYLGAVLVRKKDFRLSKSAYKAAEGLVETWNQNLSGDVYGYSIDFGDEHDSCWGFYGMEAVVEAAYEAAQYMADEARKKHEAKLKTFITNKVPLSKRVFA